jgi:hypothetical protein
MKQIITSVLLALVAMTAAANDGTYFTDGNQLIPLQETQISVKKEVLTISLRDNGYADVDVYYEFYNPESTTKSVKMGFEADPPYNDAYEFYPSGVHPYIKNFTVEMNGKKIDHDNAVAISSEDKVPQIINVSDWKFDDDDMGMTLTNKQTGEQKGFSYVYYFYADFKPGKNIVHHTYSYCLSVIVGTTWDLSYKLSPAARWANKRIDDFTLVIKAENTAKHFLIDKKVFGADNRFVKKSGNMKIRTLPDGSGRWEIALRNGEAQIHLYNFTPNPEEELNIFSADTYYSYGADKYQYGAFYDRSSPSFVYMAETMEPTNIAPADKAFRQRICHNLPFAHRGHIFKDARLKKFFESQFWYMPDPSYKDDTSDFTKTDKEVMNHKIGHLSEE